MASRAQKRRERHFAQALAAEDPVIRDMHLAVAERAVIDRLTGQFNNAYGDPTQDPREAHLVSGQVPPEKNPNCEEYWAVGTLALTGNYQTGHGWPTEVAGV